MKELKIKGTNEVLHHFITKNGLNVYMWNDPGKQNTYMSLTVKYGARATKFSCNKVEYEVPTGTAHYLEHLKFNTKDGNASKLLFDLGLDSNAYTTINFTTYEAYGNSNIYEGIKILLNFVYDNYFTKNMVEEERGIILEETNSKKDRPGYEFHRKTMENFYSNEYYIPPVIGTEKDIKQISLDDISLVHDFFYRPDNMYMVITGNFDPSQMEKVICENEKDREFKDIGKITKYLPLETSKLKHKKYMVKDNKVKNTAGKYTIKTIESDYKGLKKEEVLCSLRLLMDANFSSTSDFQDDLILSGLASSFSTSVSTDHNTINIEFNFSSEEPNKVFKLIREKLKNIDITEEELSRIKKILKASCILEYENIYGVADSIVSSLSIYGTYDDGYAELYQKATRNKILRIYSMVNIENSSEGIVTPN